jgi:hypothetical protein
MPIPKSGWSIFAALTGKPSDKQDQRLSPAPFGLFLRLALR